MTKLNNRQTLLITLVLFEEGEFPNRLFNRIAVLSVDTNLQIFRQNKRQLDFDSDFKGIILRTSTSYAVFIRELSVCCGSLVPTVPDGRLFPRCIDDTSDLLSFAF